MFTKLLFIGKNKKNGVYTAVFEAGNGKAWNDLYELHKRAKDDKEAIEWAKNVVISGKWELQPLWFSQLSLLSKPDFEPCLAGQDELMGKENEYLVDNGFQIIFSCNSKGEKGCLLQYNVGSRNNPVWEEKFFKIDPIATFYCSHGAGRSSKETLYLQKLSDKYELVYIDKGGK